MIGASRAPDSGLGVAPSFLLGAVTTVGGTIRDTLVRERRTGTGTDRRPACLPGRAPLRPPPALRPGGRELLLTRPLSRTVEGGHGARRSRGESEPTEKFLCESADRPTPACSTQPPMEKALMSLTVVNGLPAHVLFVHFVIVLVPLSALALVVCAAWPRGARRLGLVLPILAFVALASVPLATHAGEWLEQHVGSDPLVRKHAELGDGLLPWALGLFVFSAVVWWTARRSAPAPDGTASASWSSSALLRGAVVVLSLAVAAGAVVDVYRIGDSGAKAAWHDNYSKTATRDDG